MAGVKGGSVLAAVQENGVAPLWWLRWLIGYLLSLSRLLLQVGSMIVSAVACVPAQSACLPCPPMCVTPLGLGVGVGLRARVKPLCPTDNKYSCLSLNTI